jgi:hypothetical protein
MKAKYSNYAFQVPSQDKLVGFPPYSCVLDSHPLRIDQAKLDNAQLLQDLLSQDGSAADDNSNESVNDGEDSAQNSNAQRHNLCALVFLLACILYFSYNANVW